MLAALLYGAGLGCASVQAAEPASSSFVAVILPAKSKQLKTVVEAIKAGVQAAESNAGKAGRYPVRFFDAGDADDENLALYNLARSQGAVAVIGPLTRSAMNYLADTADLTIPVLALNSFDEMTLRRRSLYSFGLSIEAEVQQVVRQMRGDQVRAPIVLLADGPLALRMQRAFVEEWRRSGGTEVAVVEVKDARAQAQELRAKLAAADAVFFAADGRRASLIRPYLKADKIFYATSQIAAGRGGSADLVGVRYLDMPWLVNPDVPEYAVYNRVRSASNDIERFYALGVDAWQLAQILASGDAIGSVDGLTGRLELGAEGVIKRELVARAVTGAVRPPPPESASSPAATN